jgi:tetratricopeptide (TPR) repeat protein
VISLNSTLYYLPYLKEEFTGSNTTIRAGLIQIIDDPKTRNAIESKLGLEYIEELATEFQKELLTQIEMAAKKSLEKRESSLIISRVATLEAKVSKIISLSDDALRSLGDCFDYAYFLFLSNLLPRLIYSNINWINKATEKYSESAFFRFLSAYFATFVPLFFKRENGLVADNLSEPRKIALEAIKNIDVTAMIEDCLKKDPNTIIHVLEQRQKITLKTIPNSREYLQTACKNFSNVVAAVPIESFVPALTSFSSSILAKFYLVSNQPDRYEEKLNEAIKAYKDNASAICQIAYLKINKDASKAEKKFRTAIDLIQNQFNGIQRLKNRIKYDIFLGLAYTYHQKGQYEEADKKYKDALELHLDQYFDSLALLNRGRTRLDKGDLLSALEDLSEAKNEPRLSATAHSNLGLVYLKQGLYGKAEFELNKALELNPNLAHAYHNLGVLYNEEGNKQRAEKLFKTATTVDKNFSEARDALKKLQGTELRNIGGDWYDWWFGRDSTKLKKGLGIVIVALIGILVAKANYNIYNDLQISASLFAVLAINILIILLPILSKLKMGPVELQVQSKGERPVLIEAYTVGSLTADDIRSVTGGAFILFDFILY